MRNQIFAAAATVRRQVARGLFRHETRLKPWQQRETVLLNWTFSTASRANRAVTTAVNATVPAGNEQFSDRCTFFGFVDLKFSPAADTETPPSILWFAAIQDIKGKEDLAGLAPKGCFISAEAVECLVRQIGETQAELGKLARRRKQRAS